MLWLYISLGVFGFILLVFFIALAFLHYTTFYSPIGNQNDDHVLTPATRDLGIDKEVYQMIDDLLAVPCEHAYIKSFDGLKLHARIYKNPSSNKVAIMCHGYRGTAIRDFSGGAKLMIDSGLNVILIDERAHGLSKGHNITFGNREKKDVLSWIEYSKKEFGEDKEIILVGISMGAPLSYLLQSLFPVQSKLFVIVHILAKKRLSVRQSKR